MLWTLAAFLLIMSLLLLKILKKVVNKVKDSYYVYPSDSVIDQVLPQEIMEHVMTFLDPRGMIECRQVSKYWRHHAIKPRVEAEVIKQARHTAREVCIGLIEKGVDIHEYQVEHVIATRTQDPLFVSASAIASRHGADLVVTDTHIHDSLVYKNIWHRLKKEKKYFVLATGAKHSEPWQFSFSSSNLHTSPAFDTTDIEWNDAAPWVSVDIMYDASPNDDSVAQLHLYRPIRPHKYFYFIPLDQNFLYTLVFLFAPMVAHDVLQASYLPTIKSWFGQVIFIASLGMQFFIARIFLGFAENRLSKEFVIGLATWIISYVLLTYIAYPASMTVFTGIGIQALMFMYIMFSIDYLTKFAQMDRKKRQALAVGALLVFMMIDWKLVVDSVRDLSIFRTLFDNTVCYCIILIHFIMDNFLGYIAQNRFGWMYLLKWGDSAVRFLRNCFPIVIWMTLVAPTWRGNHL